MILFQRLHLKAVRCCCFLPYECSAGSGCQPFYPGPDFQVRFRHFPGPVEQGSHGFGDAHVQAVADPCVGYHGALPHSQRNDKFGRMAVRSGEQFFFRQAEGFQTVFNDDFRLVFPYFRGPDACGDGFSARQPGKFAHQFGPEGAGP